MCGCMYHVKFLEMNFSGLILHIIFYKNENLILVVVNCDINNYGA